MLPVTRQMVLCLLATLSLMAQSSLVNIPAGGQDLLPNADADVRPVLPKEDGIATAKKLHAADAPWTHYWRIDVAKPPANSWSVQLGATVKGGIAKGDKCLLIFYARAVEGR